MVSSMKFSLKALVVFFIVSINSLGVLYLARDSFDVPFWLQNLFSEFEKAYGANFNAELDTSNEVAVDNNEFVIPSIGTTSKPYNPIYGKLSSQTLEHIEPTSSRCLDKRAPVKEKVLYTWIDGKGTKHISDKPRILNKETSVRVAGTISPEDISLNFISHNLPIEIQKELRGRVKTAMDIFATVTPRELIVPVVANIRSFKEKSSFIEYRDRFGSSVSSSVGYYSSGNNESVILIRSKEQTLQTLAHEIMHTINRHWYGQMSQWLNEGMAEYAEAPSDLRSSEWRNYIITNRLVPLKKLLVGSRAEWSADSERYYATSLALVTFLMLEKADLMSRLLLKETENGCQELSVRDVEKLYGKNIAQLQQEFLLWKRLYFS